MLNRFCAFVVAFSIHWRGVVIALLGGVIITAANMRGWNLPGWLLWCICLAGLPFAAFFAWQDQYLRAEKLEEELRKLRGGNTYDELLELTTREKGHGIPITPQREMYMQQLLDKERDELRGKLEEGDSLPKKPETASPKDDDYSY